MRRDVFISHAHEDKAAADAVCAALEGRGLTCWIAPRDIAGGQDWGEAIIDAIEGAQVLVLVFSGSANRSKQVAREVERADGKNVALVPFRIEDVKPIGSLEYFLSNRQWIDALGGPREAFLAKLASDVRAIVGPRPAPAPAHVAAVPVPPASEPASVPAETVAAALPRGAPPPVRTVALVGLLIFLVAGTLLMRPGRQPSSPLAAPVLPNFSSVQAALRKASPPTGRPSAAGAGASVSAIAASARDLGGAARDMGRSAQALGARSRASAAGPVDPQEDANAPASDSPPAPSNSEIVSALKGLGREFGAGGDETPTPGTLPVPAARHSAVGRRGRHAAPKGDPVEAKETVDAFNERLTNETDGIRVFGMSYELEEKAEDWLRAGREADAKTLFAAAQAGYASCSKRLDKALSFGRKKSFGKTCSDAAGRLKQRLEEPLKPRPKGPGSVEEEMKRLFG